MSNGVHVIVAGDRTTLPGALRVLPSQPTWPITLPPTTLSDFMMMTTPALHHHQHDPNDFVTKTYLTTYTYLTTFSETGSTVVSSRERVVSNVLTEEIRPTKAPVRKPISATDHVTLSSSPQLTTGVYHTTYTYFNTMIDGELPLVVTSKKTVSNTITEPPTLTFHPSELPVHSTNTYLSTFAYTRTLSEGDYLKIVSTEDVLTRVVVTESDNLPSTVNFPFGVTSTVQTPHFTRQPVTTDVTKTYFVTYTYFKTLLENGQTTVKSEVATSSDVFTEKYTINPKRTQVLSSTDVSMNIATDIESSSNVVATKTYLTTFTYFTTLLQDNSSPSIVVKSRTKVVENIVMETIDPGQINIEYQSLINKFRSDKPIEFNEVRPIHITPTQAYSSRATSTVDVMSSFDDVVASNIVTGSTVLSSHGDEESRSESSWSATPSLATVTKTRPVYYSSEKTTPSQEVPHIAASKRPNANQMESIIKIGSLGLNALGPVINAMAGLIKNNLKANKRNDTVEKVGVNPDPPQALVKRPPSSVFTKPPLNIINGFNEDPETAESQHFDGFNQFQDIQQRHKNPLSLRTGSGPQILGSGIPISPGQVITANSDVIIGKPAIHGPRPPPKKTFENDNVEGMKPPPPPPPLPPPLMPAAPLPPISPTPQYTPKWHLREPDYPILPGNKHHFKNQGRLPPEREFAELKLSDKINLNNPPKIHAGVKTHDFKNDHKPPPEFLRLPYAPTYPAFMGHQGPLMQTVEPVYQIPIPSHHNGPPQLPQGVKQGVISFTTRPYYQHYGGFPPPKNLTHYNIHYHPPGKIPSDNNADHVFITPPINHFIPNSTLGITENIRPTEFTDPLTYDNELKPPQLYNHNIKFSHYNKPVFEGSLPPRPLLVNIQPSQVANVIIPHGSSVALIYNNRTESHAPKGQIINEPSAYPDVKVGMVAGLTTSNKGLQHSAHMPINAVNIEVPVSPQRTNPFARPTPNIYHPGVTNINHHYSSVQNYPSFGQYKPPPQVTGFLETNYYNNVEDDKFEDLEESDQIETEGGEVIQASNERPLRPGQLPPELLIKPTTPSIFGVKYFGNLSRTSEVTIYPETTIAPIFIDDKMDMTFTKLKTTENSHHLLFTTHSPPASTKPLPSVSFPPKQLKPTLPMIEPIKINSIKSSAPVISHGGFTAMVSDKFESKISEPQSPPPIKTHDDTIVTMNMDAKPPKPTYETPPMTNFGKPVPGDLHMSSPRPFSSSNKFPFERNPNFQNEAVLGLSPPPPPPLQPPTTVQMGEEVGKRPFGPIRKRPPQYMIDVASPSYESKISKPPEKEKPILIPVPTGVLSPPKPTSSVNYFDRKTTKYPTTPRVDFTTSFTKPTVASTTPKNISPILGGSLTVVEIPQKSEVITSDSKIGVNNVITGKPIGHFDSKMSVNSYTVYNGSPVPDLAPTKVSKTPPRDTSVYNSVITGSETMFVEYESTNAFGKNSATDLISSGATTIFYETKPSKTSTHRTYASTIFRHPTKAVTYTTSSKSPIVTSKVVTTTKTIKPTTVSKIIVTHTKTLTVTTTESTVIKSEGMKPSTHTLVITKTLTSMILDTVTEVHTLIKPTSILSTITTTIPQATTTHTIYPSLVTTSTTPAAPLSPNIHNHKPDVHQDTDDSDTILVVMTDKNSKNTLAQYSDEPPPEIEAEEEELEIGNNLLLAGLLPGSVESECHPSCRASRNEVCQKIDGIMRCVCRPGFARMFPDRPCKPTYTFKLQMPLEKFGRDRIKYAAMLEDRLEHQRLWDATREGLDRMAMQSDLRDIFHGVVVTGFNQTDRQNKTTVNFYYQLSDNTEEARIEDVIKKYLKLNNYNLGGTDVFASKESAQFLQVEDFDECSSVDHNDCSESAQCFNLKGTYTCSCNEGYVDISHNTLYPGRICSAEPIGCEKCHYHGSCYTLETKEICECFQWYAGDHCQINLKVVLLVLVLAGASMIVLLVVCMVLSCMRQGPRVAVPLRPVFRPAVLPCDKRAMIAVDTSSETSDHQSPPPYIKQVNIKSSRKAYKAPSPPNSRGDSLERDRSLTVMIPRAKYRPAPPPLLTMSTFTPQQKLINYLNQPDKQASRGNSRKPSNSTSHSHDSILKKRTASPVRKPSTGALVSAGYEVSATVGRTKELDECFIPESHTDLGRPTFNTLRTVDSSIVLGIPPPPTFEAELIDSARTDLLTVSQARSYDETTIHLPTKSLYSHFGKHTLCSVDEGHTMNERDVGSSYTMTQSHLYKSDRGPESDISNFDSL